MTCRLLQLQNPEEWPALSQWLCARHNPGDNVESAVREILAQVRDRGDDALVAYTRKFDSPDFAPPLRVAPEDIARAAASEAPAIAGQAVPQITRDTGTPTPSGFPDRRKCC